jgi:hypothetical protein
MASIKVWVAPREQPFIDELCPRCHNPSLKVYILERIDLSGITPLGERLVCTDDNKWAGPYKEYANDDA